MDSSSRLTCVLALLLTPTAVAAQGVVTRDLDYRPDSEHPQGKDLLDLYMPPNTEGAPVVVFFHGGGLRTGDKKVGRVLAERLVPHGIAVASPNYRLSPEARHPTHVQDAAAAAAWVVENAARYGGDPQQVYLSGHSAGAYLAALLAVDPAHLARHGLKPTDVQGSIPISAFLYVEETAKERPKDVWGTDPADWLAASVSPHLSSSQARLLLIYGDRDEPWRKEQNERCAAALNAAGNPTARAVEVPRRDHGSLISALNARDDQIGGLMVDFILQGKAEAPH